MIRRPRRSPLFPSPTLFRSLRPSLEGDGDPPRLSLFPPPADISWSDDTLVQPDLFVVPVAEARTLEWARIKDLRLVIEVLSLSSTRADRFTKRRLYQERRVPVYWLIDADRHEVEVWTPEAR